MTSIGGGSSTEQQELSGIAIPCDGDIDDELKKIIEDFASGLTQSDPFDDSAEAVDDNAPCKSPTAWMFVDSSLM